MDGRPSAGMDVFQAAFEDSTDPAAIVDFGSSPDGVGVAANRAWRELLDLASAAPGALLGELVPHRRLCALITRLATGREREPLTCGADAELRVLTFADGVPREVRVTRLGRHHRVELREILDGVEAIRSLQESERWLRAVVDNTTHPMYIKDVAGRYLFVNRSWLERYRHLCTDALGRSDAEIYPPDISGAVRANDLRVLEVGEVCEFEERAPTTTGMRTFLSLKFPLTDEDGRRYAVAGISTDITARKRAEAALREAQEETQRAYDAKSDFLSQMSHELRTPLNSIMGYAQLLQRGGPAASEEESADRILGAGAHLLKLINEILDLSRLEAGRYRVELQPVAACEPMREALDLIRPLAQEQGVELAYDAHAGLFQSVLADPQRLVQVLLNLLSNAVKYTRSGGHVKVSFRAAGERRLRFLIADDGEGLDEQALARIFEPFERLEADDARTEGTGLGLAVSKRLVEAMGGTIGVEAPPAAGGTVFYAELPLAHAAAADPADAVEQTLFPRMRLGPPPETVLPASTVLYIEDNEINVDVVQRLLASAGDVRLLTAPDGRAGLDLARRRRPDLILLDLNLPGMPGEEVLRHLKADARTAPVPVVVVSADAMPRQTQRLLAGGAEAYLTKPLDLAGLLDTMHGALMRAAA